MVYESQRAGAILSREGLPLSHWGPGQLQKHGGVRVVQAVEHLAILVLFLLLSQQEVSLQRHAGSSLCGEQVGTKKWLAGR